MQHLKNMKELEQVLDVSVSLFEDAYFDSTDTPYATMMGLFASIVEQCQALLTLLKNNQFTSTQSIVRNILENYVDIKNIELEGNYVNYLWSEYYNREKELTKVKSLQKKYRIRRNECYALYRPDEEFRCLTISEKFSLASLKEEYITIYCVLSAHTHSGVFALINRVMETNRNNKLSSQSLFKKTPSDLEINSIPLVTHYLLDSCEVIAKGHGELPLAMIRLVKKMLMESSS